ncbi:myomegalin isoform X5 [Ascaphus truei]|uniref:myomegalin isoform X5 n=1 Tax=Ascaphus truei TaxID=8439 RepID=UPI003F591FCD
MLDSKMKEMCRICSRELCGNQRRWIFHTASKLNLQVVLSHVLGKEVSRDGKAEFACSKCAFVLERIYRFDTVIARIEALSIERLQKLLSEKDRLKHCLASLYRKNNSEEASLETKAGEGIVDISNLPDVQYSALLQEDFAFSGFECWTELEDQIQEPQHCPHTEGGGVRPRRCRGCSALRVADSDYEAICKVPRKVARSISGEPSTRYSASMCNEEVTVTQHSPGEVPDAKLPIDAEGLDRMSSGSSVESVPTTLDTGTSLQKDEDAMKATSEDSKCDCCSSNPVVHSSLYGSKLDLALSLVKTFDYRPVQRPRGSRIPVKSSPSDFKLSDIMTSGQSSLPATGLGFLSRIAESPPMIAQDFIPELAELQDLWQDIYEDYMPLRMQNLIEKQQQDVNEHQAASGEHVSQLQSGELQLQTVQCRLQETEASNKMLQENLHQRAGELNSAREAMQTQDHVIQSLRETLQSRESEVEELYHVIEGHNDTIAKLREMLQRSQSEHVQVTPSQLQLLDLQNTLFCTQMELQKQQRGLRQKERQMTDAMRSQRFLEADLLEGQQQKETTWKHNQELHGALHKLQAELQDKSQQLRNLEEEKCTKLHAQEQTVQRLKQTLSQKEQLLQEYMDLLEYQQSLEKCPGGNDHVLEKLRQRIKDRDAALERAVDDKFCSLEEKEKEMQQLKLITRDKERDLDRLRSVLSGNKETINSLDNLMKGKDLELEQISAAYKNLQWLKQETEEKYSRSLMERETITQQLQSALQERGKEVEEMAACFLRSPELGSSELVQELHVCLQQKEKMLQEALHGRSQQAAEHEREIQELLTTIASEKMDQVVVCRNCMLKEQQTFGMEALDQSVDVSCLQILLQEKDQIIQELTQAEAPSGHPMSVSMKHSCENMKAADIYSAVNVEKTQALENNLAKANDELQLILRKEREKQLELSGLQSIVMKQSEQLQEQAADMETLSRSVQIKEDLIKDLQMQLVDPEEVPTVERLIQEVITLKEKVASMEIFGQSHSGDRSQKLSELLEVLAADRNRLNEALETEKQLYSSLVQFHTDPDSFQNSSALQAELLAAQSLRGQLEETLGRATERLAQLESESRSPAVIFGGLNEDEEEEDSSSQFTDSIEDEADVHATLGRAEQQNVVNSSDSCFELEENVASAQNVVSEKRLQNELLQLRCELHQVTAQKTKAEEELCVLKAKLNEAGIFSTADIRNVLQHLCPEKEELEVEMESATLGQREDEKMEEEGGSVEEGLRVEIRKLQGKMGQAETVIKHLKEQLALNFRDGEGAFNPDLIVSMAKEIERLKMETASTPMKRSALGGQPREDMSKRRCSRPWSVYVGEFEKPSIKQEPSFALTSATRPGNGSPHTDDILEEQTLHLRSELARNIRQNQELQDKLVVSEATVHAQTDQLEQYRVLLNEPLVEQNNKQVQVDLQDLGYETCGRSENEGDREETTSPEYDEPEDIFSEASLMEELTSPYKSWGPLVTSSPLKNKACLLNDWTIDWEKSEDITVLQQHVKDLKVQLQKSQKIIRSLHSRARTLSASSDCASSQHRLKHSVSFHGSTSHSITDEDEGWQSDTVGVHSTKGLEQLVQRVSVLEAQLHQPRRDGGVKDQMRSATWPGKYDSLIQAQARELSLLRQKLREGRDVGHILSQHLSDTIKSFEELLRANDVDYYMGQGFREQLAQGSQMTERLNSKLNSKERLEVDDKSRHELLALRLSKELQQKDKIIESLQSKLEERSVTPSSSHAISESDQSDRTSFVSDDQLSTNDDLDVCSEVATASDYTQYEQGRTQREDTIIHKDIVVALPSKSSLPTSHEAQPQSKQHLNASSSLIHASDTVQSLKGLHVTLPPSSVNVLPAALPAHLHFLPFGAHPPTHHPPVFSLAEVQQELHMLQKQLAESMPLITPAVKPAHASSCFFDANTTSSPFAPSYFPHNSHNSSKATAVQTNTDLRTAGTGLPNTSALWDMSHLARPINTNVFGDASSGSSGYQSGSKLSGSGLLEEHLTEIRNLHQRLEESIHTNDRLREQLEERLTAAARGNGLESLSQLSKENRALREENVSLQVRMSQISRDYFTELEQLRELLNASRSRLKDAELGLEQQKQESQRLQEELEEKHQEILQLQKERQSNQEKSNRLQHQATLLDQQLNENRQLLHTLQSELQVYERLYGSSKLVLSAFSGETYHTLPANYDFSELLSEVRSLRTQMEQSIQVNNSIRHHLEKQLEGDTRTAEKRPSSINIFTSCQNGAKRQLFQDPIPSPPVRDVGMHSPSPFFPSNSFLNASYTAPAPELPLFHKTQGVSNTSAAVENNSQKLEGEAPDGSFANKNGRHVIGHIDDFGALKQQILEGKMLIHKMESLMQSSLNVPFLEIHGTKALNYGSIKTLFSTTSTLHQILEETTSLLTMFWRAALPNTQGVAQQKEEAQAMKDEICQLRNKVKEQENVLQEAAEQMKSTNRAKESMEQFIVSQLTRTHDVLTKAKSNLEVRCNNGLQRATVI